jgi:hypothetical protein
VVEEVPVEEEVLENCAMMSSMDKGAGGVVGVDKGESVGRTDRKCVCDREGLGE